MHDEMNEKISRLLDGDMEHGEMIDMLKNIQADESLRLKFCRYQGIGQAIKHDTFYDVSTDFSRKISQQIQLEPTYFLPQVKPRQDSPLPLQPKQFDRKWLAVAASAVAAAVLVGQGLRQNPQTIGADSANVTAMTTAQPPLPASINQHKDPKPAQRQPKNAQFNDYLQAHNSSVYTNGEANFQPYARVATYKQD